MTTNLAIFLLVGLAVCTSSSPVPGKKDAADATVLYDQRQEGGWNVRADLDNFVILLMPTQLASTSSASSPSLLDFLTKSFPRRSHLKKTKNIKKQHPDATAAAETMHHFIESKTAPYHVDISKTKSDLEVENPSAAIREKKSSRFPKVFILTVPAVDVESEHVAEGEVDAKGLNKASGEHLALLGSEEQCGPGRARDAAGICSLLVNV